MWSRHPPPLLLLTLLPFLLPALGGAVSVAPDEQNNTCAQMFSGEVPERQEVLLDSYHYTRTELENQWQDPDDLWTIESMGTCVAKLSICSTTTNISATGLLSTPQLNLAGATDPITVSVNYSCSECSMCDLSVTVPETGTNATIFSCNGAFMDFHGQFEFPPTANQPKLNFEVIFPSGEEMQLCFALTRVRVYYYQQCPETIVALTNLPETMPGALNNSTCVENAETDNILLAACDDTGAWILDSEDFPIGCNCSAGFEANSDNTACEECAADHYSNSGEACMLCPTYSMRAINTDNSTCVCDTNHITMDGRNTTVDDACNNCVNNYYLSGGGCEPCPVNSAREQEDSAASCTCGANSMTSSGSETTMGADCDRCMANYYFTGEECRACPANSASQENQRSCTCTTGYVTSSDSGTTMGDACDKCASGYVLHPKGGGGTCTGIVVKFTQDIYLFNETSGNIFLMVVAEPPPPPEGSITIETEENDEIQFITASVAPLSSDSPESNIVIRSPDDDIALEDQDSYTIAFTITGGDYFEARNTTTLLIDDTTQVTVGFSRESYTVSENAGKGEVRVELSAKVAKVVEVQITCRVSSRNNTEPSADSLKDCRKTLTFESGVRTQIFEFDINDDSKTGEDDEQYSLTLVLLKPLDDDRLTLSRTNTFVYIRDDDEEDEAEAFPLGAIIGVCAGGAVLAIMAALLCLLCLCVWRVNVNRQGFYPTYEDKEAAPSMLRYSASLRSISSQTVVVAEGKPATQKENEYFV